MRKVSIALRRLGLSEVPSLTRAELRALRRETDSPADDDLEDFLHEMFEADQDSAQDESDSPGKPYDEREQEAESGKSIDASASFPGPLEIDWDEEEEEEVDQGIGETPGSNDSEPVEDPPPAVSVSDEMILFSRREAQDGFSVTFKLNGNGTRVNAGELTVYSHTSESQLQDLEDSNGSPFSLSVPLSSSVRLGPGRTSTGWEQLCLKGSAEVCVTDAPREKKEPRPIIPVPDQAPGALWAVPLEVFAKAPMGLALTNAGDQSAIVRLFLLDGKGNKLADGLDPKLNPLPPHQQVWESVDRFFPQLTGFAEFYGTVVVKVERGGPVWAMGIVGDAPESLMVRRALNMNVDLEGLKVKMAEELAEIEEREAALHEQMLHLEAVLRLTGRDTGGSGKDPKQSGFAPRSSSGHGTDYSGASR